METYRPRPSVDRAACLNITSVAAQIWLVRLSGLISFIVHPDYLTGDRELALYKSLLLLRALNT